MIIPVLFIFGLAIGSFCNVLIDRIPKGQSFIRGRSYCDKCEHLLSPFDLIPVISFILLFGKCHYCHKNISLQYPLVELTVGILFIFSYLQIWHLSAIPSFVMLLIYYLFVVSGLLVIFVTDLKYRIIPDVILIPLILLTMLVRIIQFPNILFLNYFLSGVFFFILFLILFLVTKGKGMGFGDVKYAFFMGLILGFPRIIIGFYLSFLTGAFISLILLLVGKKKMKSSIAFGPFLALSTFVTLFYGEYLWLIFRKIIGI